MRKLLFATAFLCLLGMQLYAQKTVTGTVTDANDGSKLPGVTVIVKGTQKGTITGPDGKYSINVKAGADTLKFTFIGMEPIKKAIGNQTVIDVQMKALVTQLEELVITALGVSREKKSLGYAVQTVDGEELAKSQKPNLINSMSGRAAGVQIKSNTNLGGSSNIVIRGNSSLVGNNQALFIVDGVPVSNLNSNDAGQKTGRSGYDYGNPVDDIDPSNIESINVLKGAAATALYGSRAANGVIVITTKKGKLARPGEKTFNVSLKHSLMLSVIDKSTFPEYQDKYGAGYGPYYSETDNPGLYYYDFDGDGSNDWVVPSTEDASRGSAFDPNLMVYQWDAFYPGSPNYMKKSPYVAGANGPLYFFETGKQFITSADVSGGTSKSTFRLNFTNTEQTGIMPNSEISKNNLTFSGTHAILDNVKLSASANFINTQTKGRNHTGYSDNIMSMFRQWYNVGVDMKLQEEYYNTMGINATWNPHSEDETRPEYWDNPYWQRYENYQSDERNRLIGYTRADWDITKDLSFQTQYSIDQYSFVQEERKNIGSVSGEFGVDRPDVTSGYAKRTIHFMETNLDFMLKYHRDLTTDLNLNAFIGSNFRKERLESVYASTAGGLAVPDVFSLNNTASLLLGPEEQDQTLAVHGYFASASLGYQKMLFLDITGRMDRSSTLPKDNNTYFYPSITGAFLVSEMLDLDWLQLGKVRLNWAQVGKDAPYGVTQDLYTIAPPLNGAIQGAVDIYKMNPELRPEISSSIEGGLEGVMFNSRVGFDIALYQSNTIDQIVPLPVTTATGYSYKYVNIGEIVNKGVELQLRGTPVKQKDFRWDVTFNWAKNTNKVVSLGDDIDNLQIASLQGGVTINAREGEAYGAIMGTDFVYHNGQKVVDERGYYMKTATNDQVIGNIQPDWNAGISNRFTYKNFTFDFLFDMQMGGQIFSLDMWYGMATGLYPETAEGNEREPIVNEVDNGDGTWSYDPESGGILLDGVVEHNGEYIANTKRISGFNYRADGYATSPNARYIYDATYLKLREISLSYQLPQKYLKNLFIKGASFSVIASNVWILYKDLPYADPEASQGAGNVQGWQSGVMPATRNFGFSVNLQF
jgi:TonB-linked SusC/RagA family outer membrane protein